MARPTKPGLEYFPMDVKLSGRAEYIKCMYGKMGEVVIISLWQRIYENSYYIEYDEMSALMFSKDFGEQLELCFPKKEKACWEIFDEIVKKAVEFDVFDKELFEKYSVLTSKDIQRTYVKAKRKGAAKLIDERYLLIPASETEVFDAETMVIDTETGVVSSAIPQSKVKKSKEKEIKSKENKSNFIKENKKPTAIDNYTDTNIIDYDELEEQLLDSLG